MPRDEYDDRDDDDDRPRRRRRRDDDEDEDDDRPRKRRRREQPKSNTGLILGIVGGVLLVVLGVCGVGVWKFTQKVNQAVQQVKARAEAGDAEDAAESAAEEFLDDLGHGRARAAYDGTTAAFQAKYPRPQFDDLLKKHPLLARHRDREEVGSSAVTGVRPNRQRKMRMSLSPTPLDDGGDDDGNPMPANAKGKGQRLAVTVVVAEQPDGTWKVDQLTVP